MDTSDFISKIINILTYNILGYPQLLSRFIGFRAEFEAERILQEKGIKTFHGGMFVPTKERVGPFEHSVYYTIIPSDQSKIEYHRIYSRLCHLDLIKMFLIEYDTDLNSWSRSPEDPNILIPNFRVYSFSHDGFNTEENGLRAIAKFYSFRKKHFEQKRLNKQQIKNIETYLSNGSVSQLKQLYVQRLIFDYVFAPRIIKGIPTDIDLITYNRDAQNFILYEIKEKYPSRSNGFGLDIRRINDILEISNKSKMSYYIIVREVNNRVDRKLISWQGIWLSEFYIHVVDQFPVEGGTGMRSLDSSNPTLICPVRHFNTLWEDIVEG